MSNCSFSDIPVIAKTECIGNSLTKINNGFSSLKEYACENFNKIASLQLDIQNLDNKLNTLTNIIVPGAAKAWVKFNGLRNANNPPPASAETPLTTTNRFIYSSHNIASVYRKNTGEYRITFSKPFVKADYILIGTSSQKQATQGQYTWVQPTDYRTGWAEIRIAGSNISNVADAEHISIVIF